MTDRISAATSRIERLTEQRGGLVPAVEPGASLREELGCTPGEAEGIVELSESEQTGVGRDRGAPEFQAQPGVKSEQERGRKKFTHEVPHRTGSPTLKVGQ